MDNFQLGNVFITGGAGTLGNAIVKRIIGQYTFGEFITIYSRSEYNQAVMKAKFKNHPQLKFVLGDVRDPGRLQAAMVGHHTVLHLAAMKRIPECEIQPYECWTINVMGSQNVADAAIRAGVRNCVGISTDKACMPITAYGASKLMMEKIFRAVPDGICKFTLVRYGNVLESRGSVIPIWRKQAGSGQVTITDKRMTRFWMAPSEAVDIVIKALNKDAGTVLIPKMKAMKITDMARIIAPAATQVEIGLRSTERLHEWLIGIEEQAYDPGDHFVLHHLGMKGHAYRSDSAPELHKDEFLAMLAEVEKQ